MWGVVRVRVWSIVQLKSQEKSELLVALCLDYAHLTRSYLFDSEHKQLLYAWKFAENDVIEVHCYGADKGSD